MAKNGCIPLGSAYYSGGGLFGIPILIAFRWNPKTRLIERRSVAPGITKMNGEDYTPKWTKWSEDEDFTAKNLRQAIVEWEKYKNERSSTRTVEDSDELKKIRHTEDQKSV